MPVYIHHPRRMSTQHCSAGVVLLQDFAKRATAVCGKDITELTKAFAGLQAAQAPYFCLDLSFCHTVLTQGFDLPEDAAITLVKQVKLDNLAGLVAHVCGPAKLLTLVLGECMCWKPRRCNETASFVVCGSCMFCSGQVQCACYGAVSSSGLYLDTRGGEWRVKTCGCC